MKVYNFKIDWIGFLYSQIKKYILMRIEDTFWCKSFFSNQSIVTRLSEGFWRETSKFYQLFENIFVFVILKSMIWRFKIIYSKFGFLYDFGGFLCDFWKIITKRILRNNIFMFKQKIRKTKFKVYFFSVKIHIVFII